MKLNSSIIKKLIKEELESMREEKDILEESASLMIATPIVMLAGAAMAYYGERRDMKKAQDLFSQIMAAPNLATARKIASSANQAILTKANQMMGDAVQAREKEQADADAKTVADKKMSDYEASRRQPSSQPPFPGERPEVAR